MAKRLKYICARLNNHLDKRQCIDKTIINSLFFIWIKMKNLKKSLYISSLLVLNIFSASAVELYNGDKSAINFEGNLGVYFLRNVEGESEVNDGFSRYLFDMNRSIKHNWQAIGKLEWGVQVSNTNSKLIVNNNTLTSTGPSSDSLWLRQGYVGISHKDYGTLTIGKQWGVSYDVGGVTDWFEIFGGVGSGTYNFGTDGGLSGSGRAEQAIQYRNDIGNFSLAAQFQATQDEIHIGEPNENEDTINGTLNFSDA